VDLKLNEKVAHRSTCLLGRKKCKGKRSKAPLVPKNTGEWTPKKGVKGNPGVSFWNLSGTVSISPKTKPVFTQKTTVRGAVEKKKTEGQDERGRLPAQALSRMGKGYRRLWVTST